MSQLRPIEIGKHRLGPGHPPFIIAGGAGFESEIANVAEIGHRGQAGPNLSYSITAFRQEYEGLRAGRGMPAVVANRISGFAQGVELWGQWQPAESARFSMGYTGLHKRFRFDEGPSDPVSIPNLGNDPREQWLLRAQFDLPHRTELDFMVRHVGALPAPAVPKYTALDARIGWQVSPQLELSLIGRNLLGGSHVEFDPATASEFGRSIFLRAVLQL